LLRTILKKRDIIHQIKETLYVPSGNIEKMTSSLASPVQYALPVGDIALAVNPQLGNKISLIHSGKINCIACNRLIKKSFNQGYCFPCSQTLAQCDMCIVRPERCHFDQGTCREPDWAQTHCMRPHYVYLAVSSGIKVGITRETQIPTRWIDQGATQAMPIYKVQSRYQSGLLEIALAKHISDKTNWRKMLQGNHDIQEDELNVKRDELLSLSASKIEQLMEKFGENNFERLSDQKMINISYPVLEYPTKVASLNFDKTPEINGTLLGIKGQYLILDNGVLNIRKFTGYELEVGF